MALPLRKNDLRSRLARRSPDAPRLYPETIARAEELERQLGRPLRTVIDGPLSDEESEEQLLARMTDDCEWMSVDELLARHGGA